jgi:N-acetyl-anhydromuramyl-L-alanine amidase AmpD
LQIFNSRLQPKLIRKIDPGKPFAWKKTIEQSGRSAAGLPDGFFSAQNYFGYILEDLEMENQFCSVGIFYDHSVFLMDGW